MSVVGVEELGTHVHVRNGASPWIPLGPSCLSFIEICAYTQFYVVSRQWPLNGEVSFVQWSFAERLHCTVVPV